MRCESNKQVSKLQNSLLCCPFAFCVQANGKAELHRPWVYLSPYVLPFSRLSVKRKLVNVEPRTASDYELDGVTRKNGVVFLPLYGVSQRFSLNSAFGQITVLLDGYPLLPTMLVVPDTPHPSRSCLR